MKCLGYRILGYSRHFLKTQHKIIAHFLSCVDSALSVTQMEFL